MLDRDANILLVDIGNSRVKWGLASAGSLVTGTAFATASASLPDEFERCWGELPLARIWVANVAGPEIGLALQIWSQARYGFEPRFIRSEARANGVVNGYDVPERLGVDRWAALVAAREACAGPACVADCGTAITLDVLDGEGRHLGGMIAPGVELMRQALTGKALGLANIAAEYRGVLARDTGAAMASGSIQAAAGLIERGLAEAARRLGCAPALLLCGGDADTIAAEFGAPCQLKPDLVLEGLLVIAGSEP